MVDLALEEPQDRLTRFDDLLEAAIRRDFAAIAFEGDVAELQLLAFVDQKHGAPVAGLSPFGDLNGNVVEALGLIERLDLAGRFFDGVRVEGVVFLEPGLLFKRAEAHLVVTKVLHEFEHGALDDAERDRHAPCHVVLLGHDMHEPTTRGELANVFFEGRLIEGMADASRHGAEHGLTLVLAEAFELNVEHLQRRRGEGFLRGGQRQRTARRRGARSVLSGGVRGPERGA